VHVRVAIIGQQPFAAAVLEGFLARGDAVAGVFCAPEKPGAAVDPLRTAASDRQIPVFQLKSLRSQEAQTIMHSLSVDLGVMAYVLQFVPDAFVNIPTHGTIQYHPSMLPRHRGPSSINWPIILGESHTGLTIFRPTDGLDEGPIVLQKTTPIGPDETLGDVYFKRLYPMGVAALLEAADVVTRGAAVETTQDSTLATYEGWCRGEEARINWHNPVDQIYNLIRGCDPSPGAWTRFNGRKLQVYAASRQTTRRFTPTAINTVGTIVATGEGGFSVCAHGGHIAIGKVRYDGGDKVSARRFCEEHHVVAGAVLGGEDPR
jgi:methionyl-tRNA formyltransferase